MVTSVEEKEEWNGWDEKERLSCFCDDFLLRNKKEVNKAKLLNLGTYKWAVVIYTFLFEIFHKHLKMLLWWNIHNMKVTILNVQYRGIQYIYSVVQIFPLSICRTFSSSPLKFYTMYMLNASALGNLCSTICLQEFAYYTAWYKRNHTVIVLLCMLYFT